MDLHIARLVLALSLELQYALAIAIESHMEILCL